MWPRNLRRPIMGAKLHRTVRFARRYNGQNETPHTTYFQQPPQPPKAKRNWVRGTLIAFVSFQIGGFVSNYYHNHVKEAIEDEDGEESAAFLELAVAEDMSILDKHRILSAGQQLRQSTSVPFTDFRLAQSVLEFGKGYSAGVNCVGHTCMLPSNLPCEDTEVGGEWTYFPEREKNWSFHCIFDGHAGPRMSHALPDILPGLLGEKLHEKGLMGRRYVPNDPLIIQTMKQAFKAVDELFLSKAKEAIESQGLDMSYKFAMSAPVLAGSCALVALFDPVNSVVRVANTGDSRAVLGRWDNSAGKYIARPMSVDQTGFNPDEVKRLRSEHPGEESVDPKTGRVHGIAVSRAFGDARWKWPNEFTQYVHEKLFGPAPRPNGVIKTPPYLTAEPEVMEAQVQIGDKPDFLIMASDGLWDNISSDNAIVCVQQWLDKYSPTDFETTLEDKLAGLASSEPASPDSSVRQDASRDDDTYYDESERCMKWRVEPKHFIVEDDNCGVHLIKNALGGRRRNLFCGVMGVPAPLSRNVRDDITVQVLFFGVNVKDGDVEKGFRQSRPLQDGRHQGKSVQQLQE